MAAVPHDPARRAASPLTVAIIGLGYVGLPLSRAMWSAGHRVIGLDNDPAKVQRLGRGECYLRHLGADFVAEMLASGRFEPTGDAARLAEADAVLICVPTPLDEADQPDLTYVDATIASVAEALRARGRLQLIVLESTTYPGTTRQRLKPALDAAGVPYRLAFSPEREDPGRRDIATTAIPKVVGAIDRPSLDAAVALYSTAFERVVPVESADIAEAAKLLENIYRAVNIALVNEMKVVLDRLGIDVWKVIEAASTKPFGFSPFYPGPGLGGHCIPIDPFYLAWRAKQAGVAARFIELAGDVNQSMPRWVVSRTLEALAGADGSIAESAEIAEKGAGRAKKRVGRKGDQPKPLTSSASSAISAVNRPLRILILGLAYKPDIDDVRESPSFELIHLFREAGCAVDYSDPHVPRTHPMRHYGDLGLSSVELTPQSLATYDAVVIATAHKAFDWPLIAQRARLIIDTRNAMKDYPAARVVKA